MEMILDRGNSVCKYAEARKRGVECDVGSTVHGKGRNAGPPAVKAGGAWPGRGPAHGAWCWAKGGLCRGWRDEGCAPH